MTTYLNNLKTREEELWEMKAQIPGLPKNLADKVKRDIEIELARISRDRLALAFPRSNAA